MLTGTLSRYWHTLRHLRPAQGYGRLWFRMVKPRPDLRAAPAVRRTAKAWTACARAASMTGSGRFRFLGVEHVLQSAKDWNNTGWPKLWLYNLHYFDNLMATGSSELSEWNEALLQRWVAENPPGSGNGWEPYPTSLRIVNWVKWALSGNTLDDAVRHSLAVQARWLRKRPEIHLLGNHLWANAKALVFAGMFFAGDEAAAWRTKGLAILQRELREQILADGGHFERSPMYHAIVLEDVLDLIQLAAMYPGLFAEDDVASWRSAAARMQRWLRVVSHPDGGIAFFNDAAFGIAPDLAALAAYARVLGVAVDDAPLNDIEVLPESGYVRLQTGPAVLFVDAAPIGPDYLPGHAHADTLSFELSLHGRRVLVNGGTSTYENGVARMQERGTAMHNTVEVDGANSSEVWGSFRVARRARPMDVRWGRDGEALWVEASHDGYKRMPGKVIHRRRWTLQSHDLRVTDTLTGRFGEARAYFRFAPGLSANCVANEGDVEIDGSAFHWRASDASSAAIVPGKWHPRFGTDDDCQVLVVSFAGTALETVFRWN